MFVPEWRAPGNQEIGISIYPESDCFGVRWYENRSAPGEPVSALSGDRLSDEGVPNSKGIRLYGLQAGKEAIQILSCSRCSRFTSNIKIFPWCIAFQPQNAGDRLCQVIKKKAFNLLLCWLLLFNQPDKNRLFISLSGQASVLAVFWGSFHCDLRLTVTG